MKKRKNNEICERISRCKVTRCLLSDPEDVAADLTKETILSIKNFCLSFPKRIKETEEVLSANSIWKSRVCEVGVLPLNIAQNYGATGVMLRSAGLPWDLRIATPYEIYPEISFNIVVGEHGDCYDRFLIRLEEWHKRKDNKPSTFKIIW